MDNNVYAPPQANLVVDGAESDMFYVVSKRKFWVLFVATVGMYQLYWFYAHWKQYRQATQEKLWPIPRAIFAIFFAHALFDHIYQRAQQVDTRLSASLKGMATLYVVLTLITNLGDRILIPMMGEIATLITMILIPLVGWPLMKAQHYANAVCGDPQGLKNNTFTAVNYIWIVFGVLLWALVIMGSVAIITGDTMDTGVTIAQ